MYEDFCVEMDRRLVELHCRRKERRGGNCGRAVTTVDKRLSQRVWLCTKEEGWNGTQVSK